MQNVSAAAVARCDVSTRPSKRTCRQKRPHSGQSSQLFLDAHGENPKVIQELLRHANLKVTMDTYVQAVSDEKRNAQSKVVKMLLPGIRRREAV
jgi:integrase